MRISRPIVKQMNRKSILLAVLTAFALPLEGNSQGVILNAGDTWSYHFTALDLVGTQSSSGPMPFTFGVTTLSPNYTFVSYQLFEGQPAEGLFYSGSSIFAGGSTATSGIGLVPPSWQDLEGSITFSTTAPISLESLTIQVIRPGTIVQTPFGDLITSWDVFQTTVVPIPEPTTFSLFANWNCLCCCRWFAIF